MKFTDIFIRRPVLAMVVSLAILVLGIRSFFTLPTLEYPHTENGVVTVTTSYPGADPDAIAGFITTPLENAIAQANGIDYLTSTSQSGTSTITATLRQNYDSSKAVGEINIKVNSVLSQLPTGAEQPSITLQEGQTIDAMYMGFASTTLTPNQITDYLVRVVQPKLQAVEGVQTAEILGAQNFSLRAWLDPQKMAAYGLTGNDVATAMTNNDYIAAIGNTKGQMVQVNLTANTSLHSVEDFKNMVIKQANGGIVRLKDVATVTLGSDTYDVNVAFDGHHGIFIGIQVAPGANLLTVVKDVKAVFPGIVSQLPEGLEGRIVYDSTDFVVSSIHEVVYTLLEALVIVTLVIFAFLGSPRSVLIPVIAIPLSLVGTFAVMLILGYSVNLLTLLALVLAIGLVVDDAIIVVENVNRHLEDGMKPMAAAVQAARELGNPIIAMTVVLMAVYVPIGFQGGLTGALFTEFAFTLVGAVTVSAVIALTLSPMMCSRLLRPHLQSDHSLESRVVHFIDRNFERLRQAYQRRLEGTLTMLPVTIVFVVLILGSIFYLYSTSKNELAPQEDQSFVMMQSTSAPNATIEQKTMYDGETFKAMINIKGHDHTFQIEAPGTSIAGVTLVPPEDRKQTATDVQNELQGEVAKIAGQNIVAFQLPALPGATGLPVQFEIKTTQSPARLFDVSKAFLDEARKSGMFIFIDSDLKYDLPQTVIQVDRDKAAQLGLNMTQIGTALGGMLGGGQVNYFTLDTRSYKVIPQVGRVSRLNTDQLLDYPVANINGVPIPLRTVASLKTETIPETLNHFQQLNSATLSGVAAPGVAQADALTYLQNLAKRTLPDGFSVDYSGQSRQFIAESNGFALTFGFALIIVFLALAALFESFRDPLVILISVPLSIAGAMLFISVGVHGASLNIYTEVGLVTLMGLISKHGILMVEVAKEEQERGMSKHAAIVHAASIRLRPILMTTAAMVLGVMPLVVASGAGAAARFSIGLVIATGLAIGTLFTLFVVPAVYVLIGAEHKKLDADEEEADAVPADA